MLDAFRCLVRCDGSPRGSKGLDFFWMLNPVFYQDIRLLSLECGVAVRSQLLH